MKMLLFSLFMLAAALHQSDRIISEVITTLEPCPFSPNCVNSQDPKRWKRMAPISYEMPDDSVAVYLERILETKPNATLIEKTSNYYHYEFKTRVGNFIDDVEFLIDRVQKNIHYKSASRQGVGDFGKNRRRMKKIAALWRASTSK